MNYEDAPATSLVATHCACCARPLVDAESLRLGVGPTCARRHGLTAPVLFSDWAGVKSALGAEEYAAMEIDAKRSLYNDCDVARAVANVLIYRVAAEQRGDRVQARVLALAALGYTKLAESIAMRLGAIRVEVEADTFVVKAPLSPDFIRECRKVPGAKWVTTRRARVVPASSRAALWAAIRSAFRGSLVIGKRLSVA